MTIGEKIKVLRKAKGITQKDLAQDAGIGLSTITQYERNLRQPRIEQLEMIARVLGCTVSDFFPIGLSARIDELQKRRGRSLSHQEYNWEINMDPWYIFDEITESNDVIYVKAMEEFSDDRLKEMLISIFNLLSRRGKIEAISRLGELALDGRFYAKYPTGDA